MRIKKEEVLYISKLAKLRLSEQDVEELVKEFEDILRHFECIKEIQFGFEEEFTNEVKISEFRKDKIILFEDNEKLFSNTKDREKGYIKIPKVLE